MTNKQVIVNKPSRFSDEKRVVGKTRILTGAAMLSAVAYLLQFIEFQLPLSPSFAKFDFSEIPALIGEFCNWQFSCISGYASLQEEKEQKNSNYRMYYW